MEGLGCSDDDEIWSFAQRNGFAIVTKDADYNNLSVIRGNPPKVIWLLLGNCTASQVEAVLRDNSGEIAAFAGDPSLGTLAIG